jgi:hypothetical protein
MQKVINVLAVASTVVSAAVVGSGLYVYVNRASITDGIKSQVMDAVTESLGGLGSLGGGLGGDLPVGAPDLATDTPQASVPAAPEAPTF